MQIPIVETNIGFELFGRSYLNTLLNILIELKPLYCLEIGTFKYGSASIFARYFERYQQKGKLITCDIGKYDDNIYDKVYPVIVHPYIEDSKNFHGYLTQNVYYKENSEELNKKIILDKMLELSIDKFHFSFIDGDHNIVSFLKDVRVSKELTSQDGYILIDDIDDNNHSLSKFYHENLKLNNNFYEIEGMALIQNKEFII